MRTTENLHTKPFINKTLKLRVLIGAGIGLALISFFLTGVDHPKPEWSKYWMIRPIIVVALAGGAGGLFFHLMENFRRRGTWQMFVANFISLIVFILGLWIGSVLGLAGTLWD
jgi:hypothetical protein